MCKFPLNTSSSSTAPIQPCFPNSVMGCHQIITPSLGGAGMGLNTGILAMSGVTSDKLFNSNLSLQSCVESMRSILTGPQNSNSGLYITVCSAPSQVQRGSLQSVVSQEQMPFLQGEIDSLLQKGAFQVVPHGEVNIGFYGRYFLSDNLRSTNTEQGSHEKEVPNADFLSARPVHKTKGLVCDDRFKGCLFSHSHSPQTSEISEVCRRAYQFCSHPFGLALAPRVFTKCVEAAITLLQQQGMCLFNYLDD